MNRVSAVAEMMRDRKWWSVPRVPALWWRSASKELETPGEVSQTPDIPTELSKQTSVSNTSINAPNNIYTNQRELGHKETAADRVSEDGSFQDVHNSKNTSSETIVEGLPNISFSFFTDVNQIFSSTLANTSAESPERDLSSIPRLNGDDSPTNPASDCEEVVSSGSNVRPELCDGSSADNVTIITSSPQVTDTERSVDIGGSQVSETEVSVNDGVSNSNCESELSSTEVTCVSNSTPCRSKASNTEVRISRSVLNINLICSEAPDREVNVVHIDADTNQVFNKEVNVTHIVLDSNYVGAEVSNEGVGPAASKRESNVTHIVSDSNHIDVEVSGKEVNVTSIALDSNHVGSEISDKEANVTRIASDSNNGGYEVLRIKPRPHLQAQPVAIEDDAVKDKTSNSARPESDYASPRNSTGSCLNLRSLSDDSSVVNDGACDDRTKPGSPPLPDPDWDDSMQYDSDYTYYELTKSGGTVATSNTSTVGDNTDKDYEDLEYCQHRAELHPRNRRATLLRSRSHRTPPGLVKVRSRIGKAWKAVTGWWSEERLRLGEVIQRHAHAQAVQQPPENREENQEEHEEQAESVRDESRAGSPPVAKLVVLRRRVGNKRREPGSRPASRGGLRRSRYVPEGQNGFEELRRYIKQGGDFCKDLSSILQERSEAETQYAKSLSKLSGKLMKASKDSVGSVNQAWLRAGAQMETQSEIHRAFAAALSEEVVKPLRQLVETQHRIRKSVEAAVDKTGKSLSEWRSAESKSKKQSFVSARENEKLQDAMLDVRLGRGSTHHLHHTQNQKTVSDKECAKLETKRRKAEDAVKKADVEYYTFCIRAERARLEWETAVIRGSHCFQALEEERLQHLKDLASCYLHHLNEMGPKMVQSTDRLTEPVDTCDVARDIQTVVSIKGTGQPVPEQLLPDFYAEHITLAMNRDRRRQALVKLLQLIRQDLDRERRGKQGVENLARALQQTPNFGAEDSQQNVTEKLHHMRSMLTYLEAARYKVQSALAELDGRARGSHPLASHIQVTRDRQGLQQSVLKVPPWVRKESLDQLAGDSPDWTDRGAADGNSVQPDSDFDEFSSQGSEKDYQSSVMTFPVISECGEGASVGRCRVLYHYAANLYDELNLTPGDLINIHNKQEDGWWLGELNGVVGIFPATYVEEIK